MVMVWELIYYFVSVFSGCNFVSVLFLLSIGINCFIINNRHVHCHSFLYLYSTNVRILFVTN